MQNKFVFFASFAKAIKGLPIDIHPKAYQAVCEYGVYGVLPEDEGLKMFCLGLFASCQPGRGGVREGAGAPKDNQNAKKQSKQSNGKFETETIKNNQKEKNKNTPLNPQEEKIYTPTILTDSCPPRGAPLPRRFFKPTVDEVRSYCLERNNGVDPEKWFDFYQSKGWRVGSQPMKDWKAAVRTWERRNEFSHKQSSQSTEEEWYL